LFRTTPRQQIGLLTEEKLQGDLGVSSTTRLLQKLPAAEKK